LRNPPPPAAVGSRLAVGMPPLKKITKNVAHM
jgi:hypothetical protein